MTKSAARKLLEEDVTITKKSLVVAFDETGHEEFKNKPASRGRPVIFGLAGVVGFGPSIARAENHWLSLNVPGHMSEQKLTQAQLDAVSNFFRQHRLGRFLLKDDVWSERGVRDVTDKLRAATDSL